MRLPDWARATSTRTALACRTSLSHAPPTYCLCPAVSPASLLRPALSDSHPPAAMPLLHRRRSGPSSPSATHRAIPFVLCAGFVFGLVYELQLAPTFGTPSLTTAKKKDRYGASAIRTSLALRAHCLAILDFPDFNNYIHSHTINASDIGLGRGCALESCLSR